MLPYALAEHYAYTFSHLATHTKLCWKYSIALCKHAWQSLQCQRSSGKKKKLEKRATNSQLMAPPKVRVITLMS